VSAHSSPASSPGLKPRPDRLDPDPGVAIIGRCIPRQGDRHAHPARTHRSGRGTTYVIQTKDGREFVSSKRPDVSDDRYVQFVTKDGKKMMLKQDEVSTIREK